jgi:hypothetical protein
MRIACGASKEMDLDSTEPFPLPPLVDYFFDVLGPMSRINLFGFSLRDNGAVSNVALKTDQIDLHNI